MQKKKKNSLTHTHCLVSIHFVNLIRFAYAKKKFSEFSELVTRKMQPQNKGPGM